MADPHEAAELVILGAGGMGRKFLDVVEAINASAPTPPWSPCVVDDQPSADNLERLRRRGIRYVGDTDDLLSRGSPVHFVVGIGSPTVRRKVAERCEAVGLRPAVLVHPAATVGSQVRLGGGVVVCAGARVDTNVSLGRHAHVNVNVTIGHDTEVGDFVSLNPQAAVSGECVVEDEVMLGAASLVLNQRRVGRGAVVGGSACVVRDVPPGAVVKGVPAR